MSDLRIALVAEGPTDQVIIEAALKAMLPQPFVLTLLQPEPTRPEMGGGWCGVLKWCYDFHGRGFASIEDDPTLDLFDLIIIHLDADVAHKAYGDCGGVVNDAAAALVALPCSQPCPPPENTVDQIKNLLLSWLGIQQIDRKIVFCIPSKASEAWLTAALLPDTHALNIGVECNLNLERQLSILPTTQRIRKRQVVYRSHATTITANWNIACGLCSQAAVFQESIRNCVQAL